MFKTTLTRRRFASSVAAASVAAPFLGSAPSRRASAQGTPLAIEYWHRSSGQAAEAWTELADMFNAEHEGE